MAKGINTTSQQVRAAQSAGKHHEWPADIADYSGEDFSMYLALQAQRAYEDWTPIDLIELARVAQFQVDAVEQQQMLRNEGHIVFGGKTGLTKIENPRCRVLATLNGNINAILRRLGITSMSVSEKRSQAERGKLERKATPKVAKGVVSDDDLLA